MSRFLAAAVVSLAAFACGPAPATEAPPTSLATSTQGALTVEVLAKASLAVGQNRLFYRVTKDGQPVTRATLVQKPLMNMTTMKHSCPKVDPAGQADADGFFTGTVIFSMPASDMETWDLGLEVTPEGEPAATTVTFAKLAVADSAAKKTLTMNNLMTLVTLGFTRGAPQVGMNEYTVSIHRPKDMMKMQFDPVTDLTVVGTPEMPSMGHGSAGNVNPAHTASGLYTGTVNFSMAGDWVLHLDFKSGDTSLGTLDYAWDL